MMERPGGRASTLSGGNENENEYGYSHPVTHAHCDDHRTGNQIGRTFIPQRSEDHHMWLLAFAAFGSRSASSRFRFISFSVYSTVQSRSKHLTSCTYFANGCSPSSSPSLSACCPKGSDISCHPMNMQRQGSIKS